MSRLQEKLLAEAEKAALSAYAPYSKFRVGAAVLAGRKIYTGANIENASANLGICAERVAIAHARVKGAKNIEGIAISCIDADKDSSGKYIVEQSLPCGGCLQWLFELAPQAWIITNALKTPVYVHDLLPRPFRMSR